MTEYIFFYKKRIALNHIYTHVRAHARARGEKERNLKNFEIFAKKRLTTNQISFIMPLLSKKKRVIIGKIISKIQMISA